MDGPHVTSPNLGAVKKSIGTNKEPIVGLGLIPTHEVTVKADAGNTSDVYIGGPQVASDGSNGFKLAQGEALAGIRINELGLLWVVAGAGTQLVWAFYTCPLDN